MRAAVLMSGLGLLAGCFDDSDFRLNFDDACFLPGPCVTPNHPFEFLGPSVSPMAVGAEATVEYLAHDSIAGFDIVSTNSQVLTVQNQRRVLVMRAVAAGDARIEVRSPRGVPVADLSISVAAIASVGFAFAPAGDLPQPRLAALPGARELIRVLPQASTGAILSGADKLLDVGLRGDLVSIPPMTAQWRLGVFNLFGARPKHGYDIAVGFGAAGSASIVASLAGAELGVLPIEIIAAPTDVELRVTGDTVTNNILVASLVGNDANGVPVAGIVGDFTSAPPGLVTIHAVNGRGEVLVETHETPGSVTISATLPDRVVSKTITIAPRPR